MGKRSFSLSFFLPFSLSFFLAFFLSFFLACLLVFFLFLSFFLSFLRHEMVHVLTRFCVMEFAFGSLLGHIYSQFNKLLGWQMEFSEQYRNKIHFAFNSNRYHVNADLLFTISWRSTHILRKTVCDDTDRRFFFKCSESMIQTSSTCIVC